MSRHRRDRSPFGQGAARQRAARRGPHTAHRDRSPAEPPAETPLIGMLRPALRSDDPTAFWIAAAPLVAVISDPARHARELPDEVDLLDTFIETDIAETTALLHMVAAMSPDEDLRSRARLGLTARRQPMPPQVTGLIDSTVSEAVAFSDGVGENLMVELVLPRGVRAVLISYISWFPEPYVKDAFAVDDSLAGVLAKYREIMAREGDSLDEVIEDVAPADARARFKQALAATPSDVEQSGEGEQWPMLRPFVEFVVGRMPGGGVGYDEEVALWNSFEGSPPSAPEHPPWMLEDGTDLLEEFAASPHADGIAHDDTTAKLIALLMVVLDASVGDPLGWDAHVGEWLLTEIMPSSPLLTEEEVEQLAVVLPPLIRWSLDRSGADPAIVAQTLTTIAPLLEVLPARRADPHMRSRRLEEMVSLALEAADPDALRRAELALRVGGMDALDALDTTALPVEALTLERIPEDLHVLAAEVDAHMVEGVHRLLAPERITTDADELVTACRRFLVRVAQMDGDVLRRKASTRNTAAAIVSVVARGNEIMGYSPAPLHDKDLRAAFDLRSLPSQRARTFVEAAALPRPWNGIALADPALLLGEARARFMQQRDALRGR
ncbi:hypothetical protein ACXET9_15485 [Brachybacterium sp. DNPG3]